MKKCPFCGADIEETARFCLYCMQSLTEKTQIIPHQKKKLQRVIIVAAIIALVILLILLLLPKSKQPAGGSESSMGTDIPTEPGMQPATIQPVLVTTGATTASSMETTTIPESHTTVPQETESTTALPTETSTPTEESTTPTPTETTTPPPTETTIPSETEATTPAETESTIPAETETTSPPETEPTTPHTHSFTEKNTEPRYLKEKATCVTRAIYYYSCACGEPGSNTFEYGQVTAHTVVTEPGYPATCEEKGLQGGTYCSVCNDRFSFSQPIFETGHTYRATGTLTPCLVCGKMGTLLLQAPSFPYTVNDTWRIDSCTYTIRSHSDSLWQITINLRFTNLSSETQQFSPSYNIHWYHANGTSSQSGSVSSSCKVQPGESGTSQKYVWIAKEASSYKVTFS